MSPVGPPPPPDSKYPQVRLLWVPRPTGVLESVVGPAGNPAKRRGLTQRRGLVPGLGVSLGKGSQHTSEHHQLDLKTSSLLQLRAVGTHTAAGGAECVPCSSSPALEVSRSGKAPLVWECRTAGGGPFPEGGFPSSLHPSQTLLCVLQTGVCVSVCVCVHPAPTVSLRINLHPPWAVSSGPFWPQS